MDSIVVFELRGAMAHYRRPDTLGTHASYPFIPRTTLRGLIAAILGLETPADQDPLPAESRCGLRYLRPVRTVTQQLSLHGKTWIGRSGPSESFHRPTTIELVVEPHYRVYYSGPLAADLAERIRRPPESVSHVSGQCVLSDVSRAGRGQAFRVDSRRCRVDHLHNGRTQRGGRAIGSGNGPSVCPRRRLAARTYRGSPIPWHAQRDLRGFRTSCTLHANRRRFGRLLVVPATPRGRNGVSMVIPLRDCIARPSKDERAELLLVDHLVEVARVCGDSKGPIEDRLAFLAGLAHDAAKAAFDWQDYIQSETRRNHGPPGPPHAPTGACPVCLLVRGPDRPVGERSPRSRSVGTTWRSTGSGSSIITMAALDDLSDQPPWDQTYARAEHQPAVLLATCDRHGLDALIRAISQKSGGRWETSNNGRCATIEIGDIARARSEARSAARRA